MQIKNPQCFFKKRCRNETVPQDQATMQPYGLGLHSKSNPLSLFHQHQSDEGFMERKGTS